MTGYGWTEHIDKTGSPSLVPREQVRTFPSALQGPRPGRVVIEELAQGMPDVVRLLAPGEAITITRHAAGGEPDGRVFTVVYSSPRREKKAA